MRVNIQRRIDPATERVNARAMQQRIDALARERLVVIERELAAKGYLLRAGIEVEFHVSNLFGPVYGALNLAAIERDIAQSPYIEAVKSSGLHTLLPASVANHYTQQYEFTLGSLTRQGRLRPPSVLVRAAERAQALVGDRLQEYKTVGYTGQPLHADYHPHPAGALYPADTQISVSVRDKNGNDAFHRGQPAVDRAVKALLALQSEGFECFAPLRDSFVPLPGATRHLRHSERLSHYRRRDYSVHTIVNDDGSVRLENRMIAPDVAPALPMLLTVGAVWLGLQPEKPIHDVQDPPHTFPGSHAEAARSMEHSAVLKEVLGPELYAACLQQQRARAAGLVQQR